MQSLRRLGAAFLAMAAMLIAVPGLALAQAPHPWQMGFQKAFSPVGEAVHSLHNLVLIIITVITLFVLGLMVYVMVRFNRRANPNPSRTSHHTLLEVAWTVLPVLILVIIAIPSFRLVYFEDRTHEPDMTVKVTAHQWYWEYGYPDNGNFAIESRMIPTDELKPGQIRLLDVDNQLVVPVGKNIRVLTNSPDVIHSFYVPSLGVQRYAVPGRTIETWFKVTQAGTYYGQCNQICGANHAYMPISIKAVPPAEFATWAAGAKKAADSGQPIPSAGSTQLADAGVTTSDIRR